MTIDKEQLISLLEDKTGLEREQVETQLSELINRIQKAAEEDKSFEVEGLGTFDMEEGRLQFEPEDTLETEINNKYAGMKPIELIGAFKEPESDEEIPEVDMNEAASGVPDTENKWDFDTDITEEVSPAPKASETDTGEIEATESESDLEGGEPETDEIEAQEEAADEETDEVAAQEETADEEVGSPAPKASETETGEIEATESESDLEGGEPEIEDVAESEEGSPAPEASETEMEEEIAREDEFDEEDSEGEAEGQEEDEKEKPRDPIGTVLVAMVVVLVMGVGGWLIYDFSFSGSNGMETSTTPPQPTETVDPAEGNTQTEEQPGQDEEAVEPEQPSAVSTEEEDIGTQPDTQQQNRYGLMGEPNQAITNGYTIVVHSLREQQQADQNRQQLQEAGYRALINQAQVGGTTYYRVGIGQFETVSDAQKVIDDIPERYRDNNFIKRIQ